MSYSSRVGLLDIEALSMIEHISMQPLVSENTSSSEAEVSGSRMSRECSILSYELYN